MTTPAPAWTDPPTPVDLPPSPHCGKPIPIPGADYQLKCTIPAPAPGEHEGECRPLGTDGRDVRKAPARRVAARRATRAKAGA